MLKYLPFHSTI